MTRHLTPEELLQIASRIGQDPQCDDLGVLDAVCARVQARYMDRDVYGSDWLKAAALIQSLALHEPLESHNALFAWLAGEAFLTVNGRVMDYKPHDALALVTRAGLKQVDVPSIAAQLRAWAISN